jgi:tetratricopeptide (TPR) repeat protein
LLVFQDRYREALALKAPDEKKDPIGACGLLIEQAVAAEQVGDTPLRKKFAARAVVLVKARLPEPSLLTAFLAAGRRGLWLDDAVADAGRLLDAEPTTKIPAALARRFVAENHEAFALWWEYFRKLDDAPKPSASLRRLVDWFINKKADKDFDATIAAAREDEGMKARGRDWTLALARACIAVGKTKTAESILKEAAKSGTFEDYESYGTFLFGHGRWLEASAVFEKALKLSPGRYVMLYVRGVALLRGDRIKEGHALIERARLLALGDSEARNVMADGLDNLGLNDEASAERLLISRTADFLSQTSINVLSHLAVRAGREGRHFDAARYYRRQLADAALHGNMIFAEMQTYLQLPARAHLHQGRGLIAEGKLDEALEQERLSWSYKPTEVGLAAELICAFDDAGRKADADKLFDRRFALIQRSCVEYPRSAERHHRLAWFASRTKRRMDRAVQHAEAAVALRDWATILDTLAELHFQRGDKDAALKAIKKAMGLSKEPYYAAQQKRIEAGDRKAAVPHR